MTFTVSSLNYEYHELEPFISRDIMKAHYEQHYFNYCKNLNLELEEQNLSHKNDISDILKNISNFSLKTRNNAGGFYNHTFFWQCLTLPNTTSLSSSLLKEIEEKFISLDNFWNEFSKSGSSVFGSGWVWLLYDKTEGLTIFNTANQDNPIMDVVNSGNASPILGIDVWEHAYYLQYQSNRGQYLKNIFPIINWDYVSQNYNRHK